ncbi:hypothetical protein BDF14DRAFT_1883612 [Spinellus fusiger]|nr:hypothetical protein BDF14DRAFT_1883612 [Spinellus fusiger]
MFNWQPAGFQNYQDVRSTIQIEKADMKLIDEKYMFINEVIIPALHKCIRDTQLKDHKQFNKLHRVVQKQYPVGAKVMIKNVNRQSKLDAQNNGLFYIHNITKNGSYVLKNKTGSLLSRDVPTSHIKLIANSSAAVLAEIEELKETHYEVQAVIDHKNSNGNYLYRTQSSTYQQIGMTEAGWCIGEWGGSQENHTLVSSPSCPYFWVPLLTILWHIDKLCNPDSNYSTAASPGSLWFEQAASQHA